ncbi:Kinesin-like protein klpA [Penicillium angulare]|uniref:Kinesin-like protein n=1 Tax=Penicillium angulare TaxID=116970 RepID=A0A9W9FXE3_9EURO|nr:Kinesin-like protein klpA [Penicillium angulare]
MEDENMAQTRPATRSRIPQVGGLREMNSASANSRSGIMPPGTIVNKTVSPTRPRTFTSPEPKKSASVSRPGSAASRQHTRGNSFASSTISRSGSTASRPATNNFSATMGHNSRATSAMPRPQTSLGTRRLGNSIQRPATSLDTHIEDGAGSILGKRKGEQHPRSLSIFLSGLPGSSQNNSRIGDAQWSQSQGVAPVGIGLSTASPVQRVQPSKVPILTPSKPCEIAHSPRTRSPKRPPIPLFLTKNSHVTSFDHNTDTEWNQDNREKQMDEMFNKIMARVNEQGHEATGLKDTVEIYKSRIAELERARDGLGEANVNLRVELESLKGQLTLAEKALADARRDQDIAMDDVEGRHRIEIASINQENQKEKERLVSRHEDEIHNLKRKFQGEVEDEKAKRVRELGNLTTQSTMDIQKSQLELNNKEREIAALKNDLDAMKADGDRERKTVHDLRQNLDTASSNSVTLESTIRALKARIEFLEGGREEQSQAFERCNQEMMDALAETDAIKEKLRKEETMRRKLHNQVQELKGNIRVFCRVRPSLRNEPASSISPMQYPDESEDAKEINVMGPEEKSSLGTLSRKNNPFSFDRVFGPSTQNAEVFDEISQLVQSALDGYNVCIFCYGQTGSGKTHTMSSQDGMIPRAVHQIYQTAQGLEEKGWRYTMEGNFVEVYNENLNDLLGNPDELDKKKHEIRHDMQRGKTSITDITTVQLDSPEMVESLLKNADANRSVAATKANERSSRSHSVFILKLTGQNHVTGERSEGTLNLVDLAGSERLSHSGATGDRLKETQNINRSLSSLGDVIAALGQGKDGGHIPYRNSKLTYLLQFSLGGNSKTLMFVMVSPLQAHLSETLTSLKFATKVHNTHIGTAKRQARVRDS